MPKSTKGAFTNDVTQIWTIFNPPPPPFATHLCLRPYTLVSQNEIPPLSPLCVS